MKIWIDGSGALLKGQKGMACVVFEGDEPKVWYYGNATNNEMEYQALLNALEDERSKEATVFTDSRLLVGQLTKSWKVKASNLRKIHQECLELLKKRNANIVWISRDENKAGKELERRNSFNS
jgi:ribonuclease HI